MLSLLRQHLHIFHAAWKTRACSLLSIVALSCAFNRQLCRCHIRCLLRQQQPNDQSEKSKHRAEDLDNENLDETIDQRKHGYDERLDGQTYSVGSAASASAALLPLMPTDTPQIKLHIPTVNPAQNKAYPV